MNNNNLLSYIKKLRINTGASLIDCRDAILATKGDLEKAINWLAKRNLIKPKKD